MQNNSNSNPLVSIGVPVYNGEQYLFECLESIHKQTYPNWECLVINNRSTDRSLEIAGSFSDKDNRFKVITNPEFVDMTTNFNNTFKPVSPDARYFKVVCADDWIFPEYLERMVDLMESNPGAGICSSYRIDNKIVGCHGLDIYSAPLFSGREVLNDELLYKYDVTGSETTVLYRIEALKKTKAFPVIFSNNNYHFDTELAFELLSFSDLAFVFQVLSYTRRHEQTFTSQISNRFNTTLNFRENQLYKFKPGNSLLENEYRTVRERYGYFLFKKLLIGDNPCIEWHRKHLPTERKFSKGETLMIVIKTLTRKIRNLLLKIVSLGKDRPR
jgi:glycosyltransferase involved in cell wall biosynthesis